MNKQSVVLPISEPMCRTYPHTAHALAILQNDPEAYSWLLNSFIQIEGWDNENMDFEDFWLLECPLLEYQRINKEFIYDYFGTVDIFLKEMIDKGYYVYLVLNEGVLEEYGEVTFPHDALIYGYDLINGTYYVADFFKGKKYGTEEISFNKIKEALYLSETSENHWIFRHDIILLRRAEKFKGKFSPERVKMSLEAYLKSEPTKYWYHRSQACYVRYKYELVYGIENYHILFHHLESIQKGVLLEHWRQVFHFFYEHKKTMLNRLFYMQQNNYLKNSDKYIQIYSEIQEKAFIIRQQLLLYSKNGRISIDKAVERTELIKENELLILPYLIDDIVIDNNDKVCGLIFPDME